MAKSGEELKGLMRRVKQESEKAGLKLSIKKSKIMAFGPITSWQMEKKCKQWQILFSSAPKSLQTVTAATKLKTLLGRKAMTNLGSVSKNRDLLLPTKLCTVKALVFSVVMHRCEIWTIKKADTFKLWGWGRLLGVPWTAEIKPVNPKGNQP